MHVILLCGEGLIISWVGAKKYWNAQFHLFNLLLKQVSILSKTSTSFFKDFSAIYVHNMKTSLFKWPLAIFNYVPIWDDAIVH